MDRPLRFSRFKQIAERYGITLKQRRRATHYTLTKVINGEKRVYGIAVHDNEVDAPYAHKSRRTFDLLPKHGVSDEEFYGS